MPTNICVDVFTRTIMCVPLVITMYSFGVNLKIPLENIVKLEQACSIHIIIIIESSYYVNAHNTWEIGLLQARSNTQKENPVSKRRLPMLLGASRSGEHRPCYHCHATGSVSFLLASTATHGPAQASSEGR